MSAYVKEILRLKRERKRYQIIIKKNYNKKGEKSLIFKRKIRPHGRTSNSACSLFS